ncbi:complement C1q domain-containing protein [Nocardia suismassiliense]|uniref:hypothetical protein n=1 Tax=Nocardia suismassiliense TaxID=2077092 RepID=UPI00131F0DA9|nr:hypothetical protein [Nocardia suismassiliense]
MPFIVAAGMAEAAVPMGMNKNGNQSVPADTPKVKLTGWVVRSGFGETVISANDELVSSGPGTVTVYCGLEVSGNLGVSEKRTFEVMHNDIPVQTFATAAASVAIPAKTLTLARGDRVWLRMTGSTFLNWNTTVAGGVNSYLYFNPV